MGASQRRKGHDWERDVANSLATKTGLKDARRHLEYHTKDANGVDLQDTGPIAVQCKSLATMPNLKEVFDALPKDRIPVLAFKHTRKGEYAILPWSDFLVVLSSYLYISSRGAGLAAGTEKKEALDTFSETSAE